MTEKNVEIVKEGKLLTIRLNRPEKKNAITLPMYTKITRALKEAEEDEDIVITVVTGTGDYFTSGNDFSPKEMDGGSEDMESMVRKRIDYIRSFLYTIIHHPKLLVAVVNGATVGVGVTMLGLFDLVYCVEGATFHTPFSDLGICAEGCSTYTFPRSMGKSLAAQMLLFNKKITAKEAKEGGFVAELIANSEIPKVFQTLREYSNLPTKSLLYTKKMIRAHDLPSMNFALSWENEYLVELFQSEDFMNALMRRMTKNKL